MSDPGSSPLHVLKGRGDRDSVWAALYPEVQRMIRTRLRLGPEPSPDDEDLLAEATYLALENICRYRGTFRGGTDREAYAWLWTVCRNAAARTAKKHGVRRRRHLPCDTERLQALVETDSCGVPEPLLTSAEAEALLARAVPNPEWRELWRLSNRPGAAPDCRELAGLTGRTPGSVAVTLSRIRGAIRRELAAVLG